MNIDFTSLESFLLSLDPVHIVLGVVVVALAIVALYYITSSSRLEAENERLQKDYAPRRKRVYQDYAALLQDIYVDGILDLTPEKQEALRLFQFNNMMWGSDKVLQQGIALHDLLNNPSDIAPEKFERLLFETLLAMRADLGFPNRRLNWRKLRNMIVIPRG